MGEGDSLKKQISTSKKHEWKKSRKRGLNTSFHLLYKANCDVLILAEEKSATVKILTIIIFNNQQPPGSTVLNQPLRLNQNLFNAGLEVVSMMAASQTY